MKVYCKNCRYYFFSPDFNYPKYRNTGKDVHSCCNCPHNIKTDAISDVTDKYISVPSIINANNNCRWFIPKDNKNDGKIPTVSLELASLLSGLTFDVTSNTDVQKAIGAVIQAFGGTATNVPA